MPASGGEHSSAEDEWGRPRRAVRRARGLMTVACSYAVALVGLDGHVVEVEADLALGLPGLTVTGLPDAALGEARDRVRAAIVNSGEAWPQRRITLGLSPAWLPKRGTGFDLALAASVLAAAGVVPAEALRDRVLVGELGLDGRVRPVRGVLPAAVTASRAGFHRLVVPAANLAEARLVPDVQVQGVRSLRELLAVLRRAAGPDQGGDDPADPDDDPDASQDLGDPVADRDGRSAQGSPHLPDLVDVAGQVAGRTAVEVAAAGGHHLFLLGPPGSGKTMLAERLPGVLPALDPELALQVTAIHSVAGALPAGQPLVTRPPFQDPHHTATVSSVVGGGSGVARPGAASLAHGGVLFLDEAPEFAAGVLDALRQPLESGRLTIRRVGGTAVYPARFTLVLAANPCPCAKREQDCDCAPQARRRYLTRLSGPLLDRVDMHVHVPRITRAELLAENGVGEPSVQVAVRVAHARARAAERYAGTPWRTNGDVPGVELLRRWPLPRVATAPAERALDQGLLTARGYGRVVRLAWTLADLDDVGRPGQAQVSMALTYRLQGSRVAAA